VAKIVDEIYNLCPSGRFLNKDVETNLWYDIGYSQALVKTRQALRDVAKEFSKRACSACDLTKEKEGMKSETESTRSPSENHVPTAYSANEPKVSPSTEMRQCTILSEALASTYEEQNKLIFEPQVEKKRKQERVTQEHYASSSSASNESLENQTQSTSNFADYERHCLTTNNAFDLFRMNRENRFLAVSLVPVPVLVVQEFCGPKK